MCRGKRIWGYWWREFDIDGGIRVEGLYTWKSSLNKILKHSASIKFCLNKWGNNGNKNCNSLDNSEFGFKKAIQIKARKLTKLNDKWIEGKFRQTCVLGHLSSCRELPAECTEEHA